MLLLAEVRVTRQQQNALLRRAHSLGYSLIFSDPPPASPTFTLAPGGVAIGAKHPHSLRRIRPACLEQWFLQGRVVVGLFVSSSFSCICVSVYCFAESHPKRAANEALIVDIFHWTSKLSHAVIVGGDFNMGAMGCGPLALAHTWGLMRIGDNSPTTRGKTGGVSRGEPIDHVYINVKMRDHAFTGGVNHDRYLSDHFPLDCQFTIKTTPTVVTRWPRPMKLPLQRQHDPIWSGESPSYTEWASKATRWLAEAFEVPCVSKLVVHSDILRIPPPPIEPAYQTILAAQRAVAHIRKTRVVTYHQGASLRRKLLALGITSQNLEEADMKIQDALKSYMDNSQQEAIAEWRKRVHTWSIQQKDIFKFLRNQPPAKAAMIMLPTGPTTDPQSMCRALHEYWTKVETWPEGYSEAQALECLEDEYSIFVPNQPVSLAVTLQQLMKNIKRARSSSPGLDGWSLHELRQLPKQAIEDVLKLWHDDKLHCGTSTINMYRRVPVQKGDETLATPDQFRPIDVFPLIVRIISTTATESLQGWKRLVLHPGQYASCGGTLAATSRIATNMEHVIRRTKPIYALTLDYSKLFNMISPRLAEEVLWFMGLDRWSCQKISLPLQRASGIWRLPFSASSPPQPRNRGLPQGMSGSVLLAEAFISALLWKVCKAVPIEVVGYVDDISLISTSPVDFRVAIGLVQKFGEHFALKVNAGKTSLWGTDKETLQDVSRETGFVVTTDVTVLGAQWNTSGSYSSYEKETQRINEIVKRLKRMSFLPAALHVKIQAASTG